MEDLASLQKKLIEMQKSGGSFKLSERTVVDIVQKVLNRQKVKIIFSKNGKDFVTEEKISKEISDLIKKSKGRIDKVDLEKILDIPTNIIDLRINLLLSKDKTISLIENKLIANYYLDEITLEINEMLRLNGSLLLSDLSTKYDFSIDFFKSFLREKTMSTINAKLYPTRLLTSDYVEEHKQRVRPVLIAATTPISLNYIIDNFKIDEMIIDDIVKSLIDSGIVKGKVVSNIFEPTIYEESKLNYVKGIVLHNNFIEYEKLKNMGIKNCKEYIKALGIEGIYLKDLYITSSLKSNFEYVFYDNFSKDYNTNLNTIFQLELSDDDIQTLIDSIKVRSNTIFIINMNLIPQNLIIKFIEELSPKLKEEASKQYNNVVSNVKEKKPEDKKNKKSKGKKKLDDEQQDSDETNISLTTEFKKSIINIFKNIPNLDDVYMKDDTLDLLYVNHTEPKILDIYKKYINEFLQSKSTNSSDPKLLMNQIDSDYLNHRVIQKNLESINNITNDSNYQSSIKAIIAHICKKDLNNFFKNILTYQLVHMKHKIDINKLNTSNDRKDIINTFSDKEIKDIFNSLNDYLQNKNFIEFMNLLQSKSKDLAIALSNFDKKKEKIVIDSYNSELSISINEKMALLGKILKKDYIALAVDICLFYLLKNGIMIKLPYELWSISICANILSYNKILPEFTKLLKDINIILNLNEQEYSIKEVELSDYFTKLYNSY